MAIDLDADGIETLGLPTSANPFTPILFDHDADRVKTGTGWLKPDDAWLVMDRNGNGTIDSGRELFGVDTLVTATSNVTVNGVTSAVTVQRNATSGFEALAQLDSNGDKVFNAADAQFANLRLWQDANQDGISQSTELKTLASQGVTGIGLVPNGTNQDLGNGNAITAQATVTRSSGASTQVSGVNLGASNLDLADNPFYRQFPDSIALTSSAKASPGMGGSGWVRDLQEAMSLANNTSATKLQTQVNAFAAGTTRDAQLSQLDKLLAEWAGTTGRLATGGGALQQYNEVKLSEANGLATWRVWAKDPKDYANPATGVVPAARFTLPDKYYTTKPGTNGFPVKELTADGAKVFERLAALEVFNGSRFMDFTVTVPAGSPGAGTAGGSGGVGGTAPTNGFDVNFELRLEQQQVDALNLSYDALRESVYSSLSLQTRLKPYFDQIDLIIDANGVKFDATKLATALDARKTTDLRNATLDLLELNKYAQDTLQAVGFDGLTKLKAWVDALPATSALRTELKSLGLVLASSGLATGTDRAEVYLGGSAADTFAAGLGDDVLNGGAGADQMSGNDGDDNARGGAGADHLFGGNGSDRLQGGADDDALYGDAGDDILDGGTGNDYLNGGNGANLYLFNKGSGQDNIFNFNDEAVGANPDKVLFGPGITPADVVLARHADNLVIALAGGSDSLQVQNYFSDDGNSVFAVQALQFADGTTWDVPTVKGKLLTGASGDDTIRGYAGNDVLDGDAGVDLLYGADGSDVLKGGAGNDNLWGNAGNDQLQGGADDDFLQGEAGNDTLDGGGGNDYLYGGDGADVYLFNRLSGLDTLVNRDDDALGTNPDTIQLGAGILPTDVALSRQGNSLVIAINGTGDALTVQGYFESDGATNAAVESIKFSNGSAWTIANVKTKVLTGTAGDDTMMGYGTGDAMDGAVGTDLVYGGAGNDTLKGGAGNDALYGQDGNDNLQGGADHDHLQGDAGNDTLDGGAGSDYLYGGDGADVYKFGKGSGSDSLINGDNDALGTNADTLLLGAGILPADLRLTRSGDNLVLQIQGTTDRLEVSNYFMNDGNSTQAVENLKFADGTTWNVATVKSRVLTAASGTGLFATHQALGGDKPEGDRGVEDHEAAAADHEEAMRFLVNLMGDPNWLSRWEGGFGPVAIDTLKAAAAPSSEGRLTPHALSDNPSLAASSAGLENQFRCLLDAMAAFSPSAAGVSSPPDLRQPAPGDLMAVDGRPF